jgi:hypothetical protein
MTETISFRTSILAPHCPFVYSKYPYPSSVGYACKPVPVLVLHQSTPWLVVRDLHHHLRKHTYQPLHFEMQEPALWRSHVPEDAVDSSDSEDDAPKRRPEAGRGRRLRIPGRVQLNTSGLRSPFSVIPSSLSSNYSAFPDPSEVRAHLRIQEAATAAQIERSLEDARFRASFSDPEDALHEDPAVLQARRIARERLYRQGLSDTERFHDRMSHSLKRKVVIMGAPSVGKLSPSHVHFQAD